MKILCIGNCCYGIGDTVVEAFTRAKRNWPKHLSGPRSLKACRVYYTPQNTVTVNTETGPVITSDLIKIQ